MANQITIIGNLGADPELRYVGDGTPVANLRVGATPRRKNQATGEWENVGAPQWYTVSVWEDEAEEVTENLSTGDRVIVQGNLVLREYERKDGTTAVEMRLEYPTIGKMLKMRSNARKTTDPVVGTGSPLNARQRQAQPRIQATGAGQTPTGDTWAIQPGFNDLDTPPF